MAEVIVFVFAWCDFINCVQRIRAANSLLRILRCTCLPFICSRMIFPHHGPLSLFTFTLNLPNLLTIYLWCASSFLCKMFVTKPLTCQGGSPFAQGFSSLHRTGWSLDSWQVGPCFWPTFLVVNICCSLDLQNLCTSFKFIRLTRFSQPPAPCNHHCTFFFFLKLSFFRLHI